MPTYRVLLRESIDYCELVEAPDREQAEDEAVRRLERILFSQRVRKGDSAGIEVFESCEEN